MPLVRCRKCRLANEAGRADCVSCHEPLPAFPKTAKAPTTKMTLKDFQARVLEPLLEPREKTFLDAAEPVTPPSTVRDEPVAWLTCAALTPIPLRRGKTVRVGRSESNDLVLPHTEVSRTHVLIDVMRDEIVLLDQRSSNGCYLNGVRVADKVNLKVGDELDIGPYRIRLDPGGRGA